MFDSSSRMMTCLSMSVATMSSGKGLEAPQYVPYTEWPENESVG